MTTDLITTFILLHHYILEQKVINGWSFVDQDELPRTNGTEASNNNAPLPCFIRTDSYSVFFSSQHYSTS